MWGVLVRSGMPVDTQQWSCYFRNGYELYTRHWGCVFWKHFRVSIWMVKIVQNSTIFPEVRLYWKMPQLCVRMVFTAASEVQKQKHSPFFNVCICLCVCWTQTERGEVVTMASRRFFFILTACEHPSNDRQRTQSSPRQREKELGLIREIYCLLEVFFFPPEVKGTILPSLLFPVDTQWSHQECHTCTKRRLRAREIHQDLGTVGSSIPLLLISLSFLRLRGSILYKCPGSSLGSGSNHQTHFTAPTEGVYWKREWYRRMGGGGQQRIRRRNRQQRKMICKLSEEDV